MLKELLNLLSGIVFLIMHVTGAGSFPKALSREKEQECLKKMKAGDKRARQTLIEHNLRLVAHIIKKYYSKFGEQEDLISIGTIGLIKGIDSFDLDKGIRLSSYASKCIENEILMFFRSGKKSAHDVSINEPIETDKDGNALTLLDTMAEDDNIADAIDLKMKSEKLYQLIETKLEPRDRDIIIMRYGLRGQAQLPQREVAKRLGISRSYVSRIETKTLTALRKEFEEDNN